MGLRNAFKFEHEDPLAQQDSPEDMPSVMKTPARSEPHLTGLRGLVAIESLIWIYLAIFVPATVYHQQDGPGFQKVVRNAVSVLFFDESLISSFFIMLSMRSICVTYLSNPSTASYAATLIRRTVRMVAMLALTSGLVTLLVTQLGSGFAIDFKDKLPNVGMPAPEMPYDRLAAANSIFNLFYLTKYFDTQAANTFWPSATLWVPSFIYYQGFTVYIIMVFFPNTRPRWHWQILTAFALGSFWYNSWGWYSATGLWLADLAGNHELLAGFKRGLKLKSDVYFPTWIMAILLLAGGLALKYVTTIWPHTEDVMLVMHPWVDLTGLYTRSEIKELGPYARLDNWMVIVGIMILAETVPAFQKVLRAMPLQWFGHRTFGLFVAQSVIIYVGGMKLWLNMHDEKGMGKSTANAVVFAVCVPATLIAAEIFYRFVDLPSRWLGAKVFHWLRN